jgi:hypothetical protein
MINELIKKATDTFKGQPAPQPEANRAQPCPTVPMGTPEPAPERPLPTDGHKPTQVAGYTQGDEVTAAVSSKSCPHPKMLFINVPDWDGLAITYVQEKKDWRTGDRMKVKFARMRPDYTLEFDGPKGAHRNKFGRRN